MNTDDAVVRQLLDAMELSGQRPEAVDQALRMLDASPTRVALIGPYSAGKSALLKRLLVDAGTPVPDWVVVGAPPTTGAAEEVDVGALRMVDTPGLDAGVPGHEELARAAASQCDAVVLVIQPYTPEETLRRLVELVGGTDMLHRGVLLPQDVVVAITRLDDVVGTDPERLAEGAAVHAATARKLLARIHPSLAATPVVGVVADVGGDTEGEQQPARGRYDALRAVDGIDELVRFVGAFGEGHEVRRSRTRRRLLSAAARDAAASLSRAIAAAHLDVQAARRRRDQLGVSAQRLSELDQAARRAHDALSERFRADAATGTLSRSTDYLIAWGDDHGRQLRLLCEELELEAPDDLGRAVTEVLTGSDADAYLDDEDFLEGQIDGFDDAVVSGLGEHLTEAAFAAVRTVLNDRYGRAAQTPWLTHTAALELTYIGEDALKSWLRNRGEQLPPASEAPQLTMGLAAVEAQAATALEAWADQVGRVRRHLEERLAELDAGADRLAAAEGPLREHLARLEALVSS